MDFTGEYKIRTTTQISDIEAVRQIVASTNSFHDFEIDVAVELVEENLAKGSDKSGYNFIFVDDSENPANIPLGYACYGEIPCTRKSFDLYWIAVQKEHSGKNIGSTILKAVEMEVIQMGGRKLYIETSSKDNYEATRRFYLKNEYTIEAVIRDFYDINDDKVIYSKSF